MNGHFAKYFQRFFWWYGELAFLGIDKGTITSQDGGNSISIFFNSMLDGPPGVIAPGGKQVQVNGNFIVQVNFTSKYAFFPEKDGAKMQGGHEVGR